MDNGKASQILDQQVWFHDKTLLAGVKVKHNSLCFQHILLFCDSHVPFAEASTKIPSYRHNI